MVGYQSHILRCRGSRVAYMLRANDRYLASSRTPNPFNVRLRRRNSPYNSSEGDTILSMTHVITWLFVQRQITSPRRNSRYK
jgi:hypothetical protein